MNLAYAMNRDLVINLLIVIQQEFSMISDLQAMEKERLKLYGEALKSEYLTRKMQSKLDQQEKLKRDSIQLNQHIQNTKQFQANKKMELKQINNALASDNFHLSMLKQNSSQQNYKEVPIAGKGFIKEMHESDQARLNNLKQQYMQMMNQNNQNHSIKRGYSQKIKQIQKLQEQIHVNRVKEMQLESLKNYEQIKQKHQQDMNMYEKHRRLMQENEQYRKQVQGFTNTSVDILDKIRRNEYFQRKASSLALQETIRKQMEEQESRKSIEKQDYLKKTNDLEDSMFRSVLIKSPRYQKKAYQGELKSQMTEDEERKSRENERLKQKYQINSIYGGVHGKERVKMIQYIDKKLGLTDMKKSYLNNSSNLSNYQREEAPSPSLQMTQQKHDHYESPKKSQTPKNNQVNSQRNNEVNSQRYDNPEIQLRQTPRRIQTPKKMQSNSQNKSRSQSLKATANMNRSVDLTAPSEQPAKKYFMSYDFISGKPKYFGA